MADEMLSILSEQGIDGSDHVARQLARHMVRSARLIVTASRQHRVDVIRLDRTAADRAFTLKELARVANESGAANLDELVDAARRAADAEETEHDDDLADPYGQAMGEYRTMVAESDAALTLLMPLVR